MTEFYTVKQIDNSRVVRALGPRRFRECCRLAGLGIVLAAAVMLYAWQHFQCIQLRYQLEELKSARVEAGQLNQQLRLEVAGLRSPSRIDVIAHRELGMTLPNAGQIAPVQGPNEAVLAQARGLSRTATQ